MRNAEDALSRKQEIYLEICEWVAPYIRNVQSWSVWTRLKAGSLYPEAELIHNLHRLILRPEIGREDKYWLLSQARIYEDVRAKNLKGVAAAVLPLIAELRSLADKVDSKG